MVRKIKKHQKILEGFLTEEANDHCYEGMENQVIIDEKNNHFQLVETGWYENRFIHRVVFHFDIKQDAKIWLLVNNTDILVAEELVKRGIASSDIVLGFHPVHVRQYTGFATA